ncbi:lipopolysaccharide/colanic/teichoic acid biosynthesis glycosyltransferase/peptidoglycan/LPS O-acetylase OafA/YrhL [Duganella sp. 1411]|uniref:sugar transferase n=1 Tax=Duganella sp. 1411 TaxID=2806572 RepID=UPI001AE19153|nr:sugar transferase [Duganella sp. 1411]MBP1204728.1 lipopolysaccharide/colanic/teichoic acid biosynthesis glycosyltransferase/peptidoglycan/LPS O-acetylase OafA/YrhL [Duganella sp. 1411]
MLSDMSKRAFDIVAALAGLVLLAPLLLVLAAWIKAGSPGPVLYRQLRVGRHGVPFRIYKFRTMGVSAEDAGLLSLADDPRATRAGRVLRRHKLDELPQLLNVLRGEMSLVGPRPEVPRYVAHYPPAVRELVLSVAPGITDRAAIHFRDEGEILRRAPDPEQAYLQQVLPVKLDYYVRYVLERSLLTDLRILAATVWALLAPGGISHGGADGATRPRRWPRARLLSESRLGAHDWQSPLISLLRGLAALQVAAAHLRAHVFPGLSTLEHPSLWYLGLSFGTGFAHQAVIVFFVLSGWLVGGSLLDRAGQPRALRDYAIDRATRLWIVLLPAFLLMLALGLGTGELDAARPRLADASPWSLATLLGNLAGLQTMAVPVFGGNFPLWSLAYETWYYALFPLLVLALRPGGARRRLAAALAAVALASCLSPAITLYFVVWLMGAAGSRLRFDLGRVQRYAGWLVFGAVAVAMRLKGQDGDIDARTLPGDVLYSALFLLCLCGAGRRDPAAMRPLVALGTFLAGFSFTLYVVHVPLLRALWAYRGGAPLSPNDPASMAVYAAMLAIVVSLAYLFHLPFEAQTARLRRLIKRGRTGGKLVAPAAGEAG